MGHGNEDRFLNKKPDAFAHFLVQTYKLREAKRIILSSCFVGWQLDDGIGASWASRFHQSLGNDFGVRCEVAAYAAEIAYSGDGSRKHLGVNNYGDGTYVDSGLAREQKRIWVWNGQQQQCVLAPSKIISPPGAEDDSSSDDDDIGT